MLESIVPRRVSISAQILSGVQSSRICIQLDQEQSQAKRYFTGESFLARIANAFAEGLTLERMTNAYEHCMP
eukprot:g64578.t1